MNPATARHMERNLKLIWWHQAVVGTWIWLPVMVLLTRARFGLDGAILIASLYYLFVVVVEVPSGWFSDRVGRAITLRLAAVFFVFGHCFFFFGHNQLWAFIVGQALIASGYASLSGTDVSMHYDTLEALGRSDEYEARQAKVSSLSFALSAVAALIGGATGLISLRFPFAIAAGLAVVHLVIALAMTEPPHHAHDPLEPSQLRSVFGYLRDRPLAWLFLYGIALVTLEHVAHSLLQPWLTEALGQTAEDLGATPLASGAVIAATSIIGAVAARASAPLSQRFGPAKTLIGAGAVSAVIVTAMAAWAHPLVLGLIAFRSVQVALAPVIISATAAPRLARNHRATFLSVNSLAGRLGYGLILLAVSGAAEDDVARTLTVLAIIAWAVLVAISAATRPLRANELAAR